MISNYIRMKFLKIKKDYLISVLKILFSLNYIEINIFYIPMCTILVFNRPGFSSNPNHILLPSLLSIVLIQFQMLIDNYFGFSFQYIDDEIMSTKCILPKVIDMTHVIIILLLKNMLPNYWLLKALTNMINIMISICKVIHSIYLLNLLHHPILNSLKFGIESFLITEILLMICYLMYPSFEDNFDIDKMFILLILFINKLIDLSYDLRIRLLMKQRIYKICYGSTADKYLRNLLKIFENNKHGIELYSILILHFKDCDNPRCLCYLSKFFLANKINDSRTIREQMLYWNPSELKIAVYDSELSSRSLFNSFISNDKTRSSISQIHEGSDYFINIKTKNYISIIASFYANIIQNLQEQDIYPLYESFIAFLLFKADNCVSSLIYIYQFMYSLKFKQQYSIWRMIKLQNYVHSASIALQLNFIQSQYWLSHKRFHNIQDFNQELNILKIRLMQLFDLQVFYFEEITRLTIDVSSLSKISSKIIDLRFSIENNFNYLFSITKNSIILNRYHIIYQKNIYIRHDKDLVENSNKISFLKNNKYFATNLEEILKREKGINFYSDKNMAVFVNISNDKFIINKFTSNLPNYLGYSDSELQGLLLNQLMPRDISVNHNKYVLDFINQRRDPIYKTAILKSFAICQNKNLKLVSILMKLDYFSLDDVYLGGFIIDDSDNDEVIILTKEDG